VKSSQVDPLKVEQALLIRRNLQIHLLIMPILLAAGNLAHTDT